MRLASAGLSPEPSAVLPHLLKLHLTAIVAMTADRVIGRAGSLPWHLPEDLAFFKRTTSGHPVVMGRKTFESIGRPLPKRRNIVLTRDPAWSAPGVEVIHRPEDLKSLPGLEGRVFIIGGSEIYMAFLPEIDDLLVSHVFAPHEGDTRFPEFEQDFPNSELLENHAAFEIRRWKRDARLQSRLPAPAERRK
ncbi:MAG: dihydrofolate reductase [Verrucomicrobiaceae bacterium]|nr:MAG: dihydrofolate reductase [Verrucomicrobiaceae bacterium]